MPCPEPESPAPTSSAARTAQPSTALSDGPWIRAARGAGLYAHGTAQPTIFARMTARATKLGAMNLGQGFPDTDPPEVVARTAQADIARGLNQYPPGRGRPELREAIARHQQRFWALDVDPETEVLVTAGATEAIAATLLALVSPGDEVLTLEPYYDSYAAMIALAGGVHRTVPMTVTAGAETAGGDSADQAAVGAAGLRLSVEPGAFAEAITDRTRVILLNTPHNPTGLQLDAGILAEIVEAAREHDALIVSDEVYEHLTYAGPHRPVASVAAAAERTVTIGSAGKTLSVTGWKIGWATGPAPLITAITGVKQWLTYASGAPLQRAVAAGLDLPDADYAAIAGNLEARRDELLAALEAIGVRATVPEAGYFVLADFSVLGEADAAALCERLPAEAGVVAIPVSAFCRPDAEGGHASRFASLVRLAFCKDAETIAEAGQRLARWAGAAA